MSKSNEILSSNSTSEDNQKKQHLSDFLLKQLKRIPGSVDKNSKYMQFQSLYTKVGLQDEATDIDQSIINAERIAREHRDRGIMYLLKFSFLRTPKAHAEFKNYFDTKNNSISIKGK